MRTDEQARIEAKMDTMIALLSEVVALLHEVLDRPRPTVVHLSAWSKVQLERLARVLIEQFFKVWKEKP